jgi:hypothetical protein
MAFAKARLACTVGVFVVSILWARPLDANAQVEVCNQNCICVYWQSGGDAWVEVRCPGDSGWVGSGSIPSLGSGELPGFGTWGGGTPTTSQALGLPLNTELTMLVGRAANNAKTKLHGDRVNDPEMGKNIYVPNNCTRLFQGSKFNEDGYSLLNGFVSFRSGDGVYDPNNPTSVPCNEGRAAWTTCCTHSKYVYICGASFSALTVNDQTKVVIHETLHVAGQLEAVGGNTGGTTPPSPAQIDQAVKDACGL